MNRRASRYNHRDRNEAELLLIADRLGLDYYLDGPLDLWIYGSRGFTPVEIKSATGRLTNNQKAFIATCDAHNRPYQIWRTPDDVVRAANGRNL